MKKQYETPKADKVEFDYTETVTASRWPWCCGKTGSDNSASTDSTYWEDTGSTYWEDTGSSYWNGN